jgi:hypothetical protein
MKLISAGILNAEMIWRCPKMPAELSEPHRYRIVGSPLAVSRFFEGIGRSSTADAAIFFSHMNIWEGAVNRR